QLKPESAEVRALALVRMVPGSARNWIAVNAVQQSSPNKKYENSICSKTNSLFAFATRSPSHCTGAGYHLRVDSRPGPRNAFLRRGNGVHCWQPKSWRALSKWPAQFDVQRA